MNNNDDENDVDDHDRGDDADDDNPCRGDEDMCNIAEHVVQIMLRHSVLFMYMQSPRYPPKNGNRDAESVDKGDDSDNGNEMPMQTAIAMMTRMMIPIIHIQSMKIVE